MMIPKKIKICGKEHNSIEICHIRSEKHYTSDMKRVEEQHIIRIWLVPEKAMNEIEWNGFIALIEVDGETVEVYLGGDYLLIEKEEKNYAEFERN